MNTPLEQMKKDLDPYAPIDTFSDGAILHWIDEWDCFAVRRKGKWEVYSHSGKVEIVYYPELLKRVYVSGRVNHLTVGQSISFK